MARSLDKVVLHCFHREHYRFLLAQYPSQILQQELRRQRHCADASTLIINSDYHCLSRVHNTQKVVSNFFYSLFTSLKKYINLKIQSGKKDEFLAHGCSHFVQFPQKNFEHSLITSEEYVFCILLFLFFLFGWHCEIFVMNTWDHSKKMEYKLSVLPSPESGRSQFSVVFFNLYLMATIYY